MLTKRAKAYSSSNSVV